VAPAPLTPPRDHCRTLFTGASFLSSSPSLTDTRDCSPEPEKLVFLAPPAPVLVLLQCREQYFRR
jgi:hypothetical protein